MPVAAAGAASAILVAGPRNIWGRAGLVLVLVGILGGFHAERQVGEIRGDWDAYWDRRVDEVGELLSEELDRRQIDGTAAAEALLAAWEERGRELAQSDLEELRQRFRSSALALYDSDGELVAWDGVHRGKVPETVQRGARPESYRDLPLFGYLYLTQRDAGGSVAVAAYLLRAALPEGLGADMGDLASRFFEETGERIRITEEDPGVAEAIWDLALDEDRLLSVVLERPTADERAAAVQRGWSINIGILAGAAWVLLAFGGPFALAEALAAVVTLLVVAAFVPVEGWDVAAPLFGPEGALVGSLGLGRLALVVAVLGAFVGVAPRLRVSLSPSVIGAIVAVAFPLVLLALQIAVEPAVLAQGRTPWIAYQFVGSALLSILAGVSLTHAAGSAAPSGRLLAAAGFGAVGLSALLGGQVAWFGSVSVLWAAAWALPGGVAALALQRSPGWRSSVVRWTTAALLGSTATIPVAWGQRVEARLAEGAQRLTALAAVEDVELEDRLLDFARLADSLDASGAEDVSVLYDGWRLSGLAETGYPVWLQIEQRDGSPGEGLRIGVAETEPQPYQDLLAQGRRAGGVQLAQLDQDDARYILTAELSGDRMLGAVAPPFPETAGRSAMGTLLRGVRDAELEALSVLPLPEEEAAPAGGVQVVRTPEGWRAELGLRFSNGPQYLAHYAVERPGAPLALARGTLLAVANLFVLLLFWAVGRALSGETGRRVPDFSRFVISFRARVTLALFGFFALANALFGTVAYRTLAQASHRSAEVIAERVVEDAANWYRALEGRMELLASQVGAELLEYRNGELREGSLEELVELGLYEGWTPYDVHRTLAGHESVQALEETSVGRWEYVTAYRRLPDGDVLAAQVPLQEGSSALQTTDLIEILAFVVLLGAGLSLALAMVAGRALTRPIRALQLASERVGSGDLGLRLPAHRSDEFGAVFRAFNRMVGRVRRARRQLLRTTRRTQLIMDEAAVGMVALDPGGRVTLVNPRAEELLGSTVVVGRELPAEGDLGEALTRWLSEYLEGQADEANTDVQVGERRVRVRARRLGSFGTRRGVVVALDDVTDELRAERVLAWGEMARQVAHEVKNPLTPIKLSIQHVRRAWDDDHPDFDAVLTKNADAMLAEIDRLAEIAQSFSRFGAPGAQEAPLSPVFVGDVIAEVMALYGGSAARIRFEADVEPRLPPVLARTTELKEVLVNLLENARLAGREGTRVVITARRGEGEPEAVILAVADDGVGIPADVLPRIFEPQFSTRSKGTGLGLAIVQRVVRAWGGSVTVESEVGQGTTVFVTLQPWDGGENAQEA
ncbi:MAG: HAMP domain-containing protein [Gemmatimonadetes bacterium]|nr:HAMP domain-containing protein [Gemmatimonadota bacterium]